MRTPTRMLFLLTRLIFCSFVCLGISSCTKKQPPQTVAGKIEMAPALERIPIQPSAALYLIVRPAGVLIGPPLAVKRYTPPFRFPIDYTVSSADAMIPDTPFTGPFEITARLSQSGSATPALKGDFEGSAASQSVPIGAQDVVVTLSKVRTDGDHAHSKLFHRPHRR